MPHKITNPITPDHVIVGTHSMSLKGNGIPAWNTNTKVED